VLQYNESQREVLRAAVESVPAALREVSPPSGRWSVAGVLEHLAKVETGLARLFTARLAEAKARGLTADPETAPLLPSLGMERVVDRSQTIVAPPHLQPQGLGAAAAWAALEAAGAAFREAFLAGDGLAWSELFHPHPTLGPFHFYQWAAFIGAHEARHAAQIREIGAVLAAGAGAPPA